MPLRLIYAGGTIGCAGTPLAPLPSAAFRALWEAALVPALPAAAGHVWDWLDPALDSSAMGPADWGRLADRVLTAAEQGAEGCVLLHGTDTLASTAAALSFLLTDLDHTGAPAARLAMPLVLTGSQRPLFEGEALAAGTDATANISAAIEAAGRAQTAPLVVFAGALLPATRVAKVHTKADAAFACPNEATLAPALPAADHAGLRERLARLAPHLGERAVLVFTPQPETPEVTRAALRGLVAPFLRDGRLGGLIIAGFGAGSLAPALAGPVGETIAAVRGSGGVVVAASQVPAGPSGAGAYAAGHWLAGAGALPAGDIPLAALHAKLHIGLALAAAERWAQGDLEAFMGRDLAGES
ncbi:MAG: asparaginase domain-containing protein [Pseudomonadota bacterium]